MCAILVKSSVFGHQRIPHVNLAAALLHCVVPPERRSTTQTADASMYPWNLSQNHSQHMQVCHIFGDPKIIRNIPKLTSSKGTQ